ncbi:sulfotransferase [Marinicella sediminis]|uniref:Sulfotransferase n=1 Tax=Marinicella sediminis TaxID=1792834 RepID=A0ABV7JDX1_9GAMM|nr:sulfotransferase [Marinicella sediminis]
MSDKPPVIFISGRFRSGSSFLWQLFDQLPGFCAWYEPLHPQLLAAIEHTKPKTDHVGITDYWSAYRQHPEFQSHYQATFATEQLYLEATDQAPELQQYIERLIALSAPEVPVLQFNRMDLRLSWLKSHFPQATVIHTERNPLQLYHSQRKHIPEPQRHQPAYWDAYELMPWCLSLSETFPFLLSTEHEHAFFRCYLLQRMSSLCAASQADLVINLDQDVFEKPAFIRQLMSVVSLTSEQQKQLKAKVHLPEIPVFDEQLTDTLSSLMTAADLLLTASGLAGHLGQKPLSYIKQSHPQFWQSQSGISHSEVQRLLAQMNSYQSEMTRILAENEDLKNQLEALTIQQVKDTDHHE